MILQPGTTGGDGHEQKIADWIALVLVIVGAINWGLVGIFAFNLVAVIFGEMAAITRVIYALGGRAQRVIPDVQPLLANLAS